MSTLNEHFRFVLESVILSEIVSDYKYSPGFKKP